MLFPLGNHPESRNVGIFLEKRTDEMEREVQVELTLRRPPADDLAADGDDDDAGGGRYGGTLFPRDFTHWYPASDPDVDGAVGDGDGPGHDWGLRDAFPQADVLRDYIDDDGELELLVTIYHLDFARPADDEFDHAVDDARGGGTLSGRLPRLRRPPAMERAMRGFGRDENENDDEENNRLLYDDAATDRTTNTSPVRWNEPSSVYAGLLNQGATCYMNSLLQVWFHLPAFRRIVLGLPLPRDGGGDGEDEDVDCSSVHSSDTSTSSYLFSGYDDDVEGGGVEEEQDQNQTSGDGAEGDGGAGKNDGKAGAKAPSAAEIRVGHALQRIFAQLSVAQERPGGETVSTAELTTAFGWDSASLFRQHDVQELSRVLLDRLESVFKARPKDQRQEPDLFEGKLLSYIRCTSVPVESTRVETFLDIQLQVKGCPNLHKSLCQFTHEEELTGDNQYDASDAGHGKQDAKKGVKIHTLPPVLNIHLKRFEFDLSTTMGMIKVHDRFEFPLTMDLNDFVADDADGTDADDPRKNVYHLHSIVMHSGSVGGGHYFAYIRPKLSSYDYDISDGSREPSSMEDDSKWFKFDDECVTPIDERYVLESAYGASMADCRDEDERETRSPGRNNGWLGRRSRLSLTGSRRFQNGIKKGPCGGQRRPSTTSAYMLSYVRECDLHWVLSTGEGPTSLDTGLPLQEAEENGADTKGDATAPELLARLGHGNDLSNTNDKTSKSGDQDALPQKQPLDQGGKGPTGPFVKIPFFTDKEVSSFDRTEGAYIPRRFPKQAQGYAISRHDLVLFDGHVPTTKDALSSPLDAEERRRKRYQGQLRSARVRLDDTGFGLLRALARTLKVPMHRMRLWSTCRRENNTTRVDDCLSADDLRDWKVEKLVREKLNWTLAEPLSQQNESSDDFGITVKGGSGKRRWTKPHDGTRAIYVEVLPFEWTRAAVHSETSEFLVKPPLHCIPQETFMQDSDFPAAEYNVCSLYKDSNAVKEETDEGNEVGDLANLGIHLSDDDIWRVYSRNVPSVPGTSAILFFKQMIVPSVESNEKGSNITSFSSIGDETVAYPTLKFIGSALFHMKTSASASLLDCARILLTGPGPPTHDPLVDSELFEIETPKKVGALNESASLKRAGITSGDIMCVVKMSPKPAEDLQASSESSAPSTLTPKKVLSDYLLHQYEHIWIHFLPLTARDASFLKASKRRDHSKNAPVEVCEQEKDKSSTPLRGPAAVSIAVHPETKLDSIMKSLHSFFRQDLVPSYTQIRLTRTSTPSSNPSSYYVIPAFFSRRVVSPFVMPPPPMNHPIEMDSDILRVLAGEDIPSSDQANSIESSLGTASSVSNANGHPGVEINAEWLTSSASPRNNPDQSNERVAAKKRHFYLYFEVTKGHDWSNFVNKSNSGDMRYSIPSLCAGKWPCQGASRSATSPSVCALPVRDLKSTIGKEKEVHDLVRQFCVDQDAGCELNSDLILVGKSAHDRGALSGTVPRKQVPFLMLVKRNRILRLLPFGEALKTAYPHDDTMELPKGKVEPSSTFGKGQDQQHSNANGKKKRITGKSQLLQWNSEARHGCLEIGSASDGTLVLECLPHDAFVGTSLDQEGLPENDNTSLVTALDSSRTAFPITVPVQIIFHLESCSDRLELCFVPFIIHLRKSEDLAVLRRRLCNRLYGSEDPAYLNDNDGNHSKTNGAGSPLSWKAKMVTFQGRGVEDLLESEHSTGQDSVSGVGAGAEHSASQLWRTLQRVWPCAFNRGGGMSRMMRHLFQSNGVPHHSDEFRCVGPITDLPTIGFAVPDAAFEDLVRCRAENIIGSPHYFAFDESGRLHESIPVSFEFDYGNDDSKGRNGAGIVIRE